MRPDPATQRRSSRLGSGGESDIVYVDFSATDYQGSQCRVGPEPYRGYTGIEIFLVFVWWPDADGRESKRDGAFGTECESYGFGHVLTGRAIRRTTVSDLSVPSINTATTDTFLMPIKF